MIDLGKAPIVGLILFCALLGALGQIFFKLSSSKLSFNILSWILNWKLMFGLFCYGVATVLFVLTLKKIDLSIAYPIIATSYIWVALFSVVFLKEIMTGRNWLGILFIIIGVTLATLR